MNFNEELRETERETLPQQESSFNCNNTSIDIANCCVVPSSLHVDTVPKWKFCLPASNQESNYVAIPQENYEEQFPIQETIQ